MSKLDDNIIHMYNKNPSLRSKNNHDFQLNVVTLASKFHPNPNPNFVAEPSMQKGTVESENNPFSQNRFEELENVQFSPTDSLEESPLSIKSTSKSGDSPKTNIISKINAQR
jgi:hypothetical protein